MNNDKYLSIGALTRYLKAKFDSDVNLRTVFLRGEISNFKSHTTGHLYFSLKDETSKINAIMFASKAKNITFTPMDGTKVLVAGRVSVYEATGSYQIYVDEMLEDGVGNLYIAFEKLKKELAEKGMFDQKYKKPIPKIPEKIGIITASTGAAIKDIISTIRRRYPLAETYLFPCLVQGEYAKDDIVKKIKQASNYDLDVLIVGRGGGSIEDLWAFNEEVVANAIFECQIPIISAVGHEVDFTIADFVADLRAPTPTGAAEMAVPNISDLLNNLNQLKIRLNESINNRLVKEKTKLKNYQNSYILKNPMMIFDSKKQKLMLYEEKINENIKQKINLKRIYLKHIADSYIFKNPKMLIEPHRNHLDVIKETINKEIIIKINYSKEKLNNIKKNYLLNNPGMLYQDKKIKLKHNIEKLEVVNPMHILGKGYNIAYEDDKVIKSVSDIKQDSLKLCFVDGFVYTKVEKIKKENING